MVGNRYGTTTDSGKSITNTEFETAKAKGIPIFIFIDKKTLSALSFWQENRSADFSKFVDNTKIFEFISELRNDNNLWTFEFEKVQDITTILKHQLSYLFKESLETHSKYNSLDKELLMLDISNEALNIILQKAKLYEFEFFSKVLNDEMKKITDYRNDLKYRIHYEPVHFVYDPSEIIKWMQNRSSIIISLIESLSNIINKALVGFVNEPGVPADLKGFYYVAKAYARTFESIIKWTIETRNAVVPNQYKTLKECLSMYSKNCISQIWEFPNDINEHIQNAKKIPDGEVINLEFKMSLDIDENDIRNYNLEFEKLRNNLLRLS